MVEIKDYDADAYELEFEDDTPAEERQFYVKSYPNVNMVADRRLHCTTCNIHIGCAVANELTIRMHPILRVTHCKKCHTFYNSGEFSKGEDGSELYCRWCGQGGEVYCCSKCPYVFCKKCIVQNLSKTMVNDIENNDNWNCFSCSPKVMWPLRSQHWALVNYIEKTKRKILDEEKDDEKIYELMNKDPTLCCRDKKSQKQRKDTKRKRKRRYSSTSSSECSTPEPRRILDHSAVLPKMVSSLVHQKSRQLDELVCTPDIMSMFNEPADVAVPLPSKTISQTNVDSSVGQKSATSQPPPLIIRQLPSSSLPSSSMQTTVRFPNRQFSAVTRTAPPPPAYYTVNGFRVDLNAAAQQETYRLPNGKLIQVKKQTAAHQAANTNNTTNRGTLPLQPRLNNANPNPYSIRYNVQSSLPAVPLHVPPQHHSLHQQHLAQQQQILNGLANVPIVPVNTTNTLPPPSVSNRYANTPLGESQKGLEKHIHATQEACHQIIAKCNTLMKSNAYKNVRNYNDVRELQLHLSYLQQYASDKFNRLQTESAEEMRLLSNKHEAANNLADKKNKYTNVDDDLEVVEPTTVCIEIDSDDENEPKNSASEVLQISTKTTSKPKQPRKTIHQPKNNYAQPIMSSNVEMVDHTLAPIEINPIEINPIEITECIDADELELPSPPALDSDNDTSYDRENDEKLKCLPQVVLEKDAEIERKLQEILGDQSDENGSASPISDESDDNNPLKENILEKVTNKTMNCKETIITDASKTNDILKVKEIADCDNVPCNESITVDCPTNNTDLTCAESPTLTDNLENENLLDDLDNPNNLTDTSLENISSPDMFDDMSKNGFDKPEENLVTLSTENADPDLV